MEQVGEEEWVEVEVEVEAEIQVDVETEVEDGFLRCSSLIVVESEHLLQIDLGHSSLRWILTHWLDFLTNLDLSIETHQTFLHWVYTVVIELAALTVVWIK